MSNYLNNLVARTLKQAPVVQPRLASIFESIPAAVDNVVSRVRSDDGENFASSEAMPDISTAQPLAPSVDKINVEVHSFPLHRMDKQFDSRTGDQVLQHRPDESPIFHPTVMSISPGAAEQNDVGTSFATRASAVFESLRVESNEPRVPIVDSSQSVSGEIEGSNNSSSRWPLRPELEGGVEDHVFVPKSIDRDEVQPPASQQTSRPDTSISILRPNSRPIVPVQSESRQPAITDQTQPTIKVTIGRVDVRAVFTQTSPPRTSNAKPHAAMSLNDYLQQRNEGRR